MNGTFAKLYSNAKSGSLSAVRGAFTSPLTTVLTSVNKFKTYLEEQSSKSTNLCTGFLLDASSICDQMAENRSIDQSLPHHAPIDSTIARSIVAAWSESADTNGHLTITNTRGDVFEFSISESGITTINHATGSTHIETDVLSQSDGTWTLNNLVYDHSRTPHFIFDLIDSQVESGELNDCILSFAQLVTSGVSSADAYVAKASEYAQSKYQTVKDAAHRFRTAFATGGIYGLCKTVLDFARSMRNVEEDDNALKFTDNAQFVPQEYIAGFVSAVFNALSTLVQTLATIFGGILGIIGAIAGSVVNSIVQALQFDYNGTLGSVVDGNSVTGSTPYGILQMEYTYDALPTVIKDAFELGYPIVIVDVVGGQIIFGYGPSSNQTTPSTFRAEFHPDITDNSAFFLKLAEDFTFTYGSDGHSTRWDWVKLTHQLVWEEKLAAAKQIVDTQNSYAAYYNDISTGYLTVENDQLVRRNIFMNIVLFLTYYNDGFTPIVEINHAFTLSLDAYTGVIGIVDDWPLTNLATAGSAREAFMSLLGSAMFLAKYWGARINNYYGSNYRLWSPSYSALAYVARGLQSYSSVAGLPTVYMLHSTVARGLYYGNIQERGTDVEYCLKIPQYNRATFWRWTALAIVTTCVAIGASVAISVGIRKAIRKRQAINAAKVYSACEELQDNPSDATYKAYRKAVFKNNIFASLTSGTKYDAVNVWNAVDDSASQSSDPSLVGKVFTSLLPATSLSEDPLYNRSKDTKDAAESASSDAAQALQALRLLSSLPSMTKVVYKTITGHDYPSE